MNQLLTLLLIVQIALPVAAQTKVDWVTQVKNKQSNSGGGTYTAAWPFDATVGTPSNESIIRGTLATPAASTVPVVSIVNRASGELGPNAGDLTIQSLRTNGVPVALAVSATPLTAGYGAEALTGHVLMDKGTALAHSTGFPLWTTCQLWDVYDNCSGEINVVNNSGANPPAAGAYSATGMLNGLAFIVGTTGHANSRGSSAIYIGTQDTANAQWQRGIDFEQLTISDYAISLPYGKPGGIWAKDGITSAQVAMLWLGGAGADTVFGTGGAWYWLNSGGTQVAEMGGEGLLTVTGVTASPTGFASLPTCAAGIRGQQRTVLDSNTVVWGATIAAGGSNTVLAFCNGANWTVIGK